MEHLHHNCFSEVEEGSICCRPSKAVGSVVHTHIFGPVVIVIQRVSSCHQVAIVFPGPPKRTCIFAGSMNVDGLPVA